MKRFNGTWAYGACLFILGYSPPGFPDVAQGKGTAQRSYAYRHTNDELELVLQPADEQGGVGKLGKTNAEYKLEWDSGSAEFISNRKFSDLPGPLKLVSVGADPGNKHGVQLKQRLAFADLQTLSFLSLQPDGSQNKMLANRLSYNVSPRLALALDHAQVKQQKPAADAIDNVALGMDLSYEPNPHHQLRLAHAHTALDGSKNSIGQGARLGWQYQTDKGYGLQLGYLALSENYRALLSKPPVGEAKDAVGPEAALTLPLRFSIGDISGGKLEMKTHSLKRTNEDDVRQFNVGSSWRIGEAVTLRSSSTRSAEDQSQQLAVGLPQELGVELAREQKNDAGETEIMSASARKGAEANYYKIGLQRVEETEPDGAGPHTSATLEWRDHAINYKGLVRFQNSDSLLDGFFRIDYENEAALGSDSAAFVSFGDLMPSSHEDDSGFQVGVEIGL